MDEDRIEELKQLIVGFRSSVIERMDTLDRRMDDLARQMQDMSLDLKDRIRIMETGIMNEIRAQSRRTSRIEERLARLEGAA
jgi:predicted transcriptional regulator